MFEPTIQLFSLELSTYTTVFTLALFIGGGFAIYSTPSALRLRTVDVLIGGLIGGIVLARVQHIVLNWNHFAFHRGEILQVNAGGLDWHGAFIGAGIGIWVIARWRKVPLKLLIDRLTLLLPLLSIAIWWGCWSASCRYGMEVATLADYPSWFVWEGRDIFGLFAPRFHTQFVGLALSVILLLLTLVLIFQKRLVFRRFWLLTIGVTCIMFGVGWLQADYSPALQGVRISHYLDLILIVFACYVLLRSKKET